MQVGAIGQESLLSLKYIGYFDLISNAGQARVFAPSAATKIEYVASALNRAGHHVLIVSPSQTTQKKFYPGSETNISPSTSLKLFPTFPRGNLFQRVFRVVAGHLLLLAYLLKHTRANEPVLVYHSLAVQEVVLIAKAIRRFQLILEVEEIYQDVVSSWRIKRWMEYALFNQADAFIFSTELLNEKLNPQGKPNVVAYGAYASESAHAPTRSDGTTHVVYAGTLDRRKGGSVAAAAAAAYLDGSYHIHILGFGTPQDISETERIVREVNALSAGKVTYDGVLRGDEFSSFLQKCHIGLSTQDPTLAFNNTSFPSKVLSYLGNGLKVVSVRIPVVERSRIAGTVTFYDAQEPQLIAEAIRKANRAPTPNLDLVEQLDREFVSSLKSLIVGEL